MYRHLGMLGLLLTAIGVAQGLDAIESKAIEGRLAERKREYLAKLSQARQPILELLKDAEKEAQASGILANLENAQRARASFEGGGDPPTSLRPREYPKRRKDFMAEREKLRQELKRSYQEAVRDLTKNGDVQAAKRVQAEGVEFLSGQLGDWEKRAAAEKLSREAMQSLKGDWIVEAETLRGKALPQSTKPSERYYLSLDGEEYIVRHGNEVVYRATWRVDPTKSPWAIDRRNVWGMDEGVERIGIVERQGEAIRICWTTGKVRPTEFKSTPENGFQLSTFRRYSP